MQKSQKEKQNDTKNVKQPQTDAKQLQRDNQIQNKKMQNNHKEIFLETTKRKKITTEKHRATTNRCK